MPYKYPSNIPERIKGLPAEAQKTWIDIYNNAWEQYKDRPEREGLAAATAWAGLKKAGWKKDKEGNWVKTGEQGNLTAMELAIWEAYSQTYELKDVEVFGTGKWNGHKITDEDIDNIVNGTNEIIDKLKPRVKLGHSDKQELLKKTGLPAGGWITKLKRAGNKILVDIKQVPKVLYQLIKNGAYKRISSEILYDYTEPSTRKKYKKVLSAIAFLGADLPAVTNLKDIAALYDANQEATLIIYENEGGEREKNKELQEKRSKQYDIGIKEGGNVTKPGEYKNLTDGQFADPVNYRYPIDKSHYLSAVRYFGKPENRTQYSRKEQGIIWTRMLRAAKGFGMSHKWNDDLDPLLPSDLKEWAKGNKKKGEYIMKDGIKITEVEGKKFVAVEDFEKVTKEAEEAKNFKEKFEAEQKKAKEVEEKLNKISKEKRQAEIKTFIDAHCSETDMRFLPKQKEVLMALIESTSDEKTIKFTVDDKETELSQRELLEKFIELQPNFSDSIFAELSKGEEEEEEGEEKLTPEEKKVKKYMAEHKDVSYRDAVLAVLDTTESKKK